MSKPIRIVFAASLGAGVLVSVVGTYWALTYGLLPPVSVVLPLAFYDLFTTAATLRATRLAKGISQTYRKALVISGLAILNISLLLLAVFSETSGLESDGFLSALLIFVVASTLLLRFAKRFPSHRQSVNEHPSNPVTQLAASFAKSLWRSHCGGIDWFRNWNSYSRSL